ncbi:hypothetical protein F4677DRAFT_151393 [Hypoxylon crocopeplum]|nr:hypothetical protein F4677DRAFT_151393 [Hypoxylon crocopeplum]
MNNNKHYRGRGGKSTTPRRRNLYLKSSKRGHIPHVRNRRIESALTETMTESTLFAAFFLLHLSICKRLPGCIHPSGWCGRVPDAFSRLQGSGAGSDLFCRRLVIKRRSGDRNPNRTRRILARLLITTSPVMKLAEHDFDTAVPATDVVASLDTWIRGSRTIC